MQIFTVLFFSSRYEPMDEILIETRFSHYKAHGEYKLITIKDACKVINI